MDAETSAKRTVTCLRSPDRSARDPEWSESATASARENTTDEERATVATGRPQNGQNRAPGGAISRQDAQRLNDPRRRTRSPARPFFSGRIAWTAPALRQLRDHPPRPAAGGNALDVVEAIPETRRPVLPRRSGGMRCQGDVRQLEQRVILGWRLLDHHVEAGAGEPLLGQRTMERVLVHDRAPARVDQDGRR